MVKRWIGGGLVLVLILGCLSGLAVAEPVVAATLIRYPGAVRGSGDGLKFEQMGGGSVSWQAVYQTDAAPAVVVNWYAERLHVRPEDTWGPDALGCTMMTQAELLVRLERAQVIVLCARPYGTQVVINEKLTVWR